MTLVSIISIAAKKVGLASSILLSLCHVETGLKNINNYDDPNGGSFGICQVSLPAAREFGEYYDALALQQPRVNAYLAARYLRKKIRKYGFELGIASYNSGSPIFKDGVLINQDYLDKVKEKYVDLSSSIK